MGSQGMPVSHEVETLVLMLQRHPVLEHTMIMPQVEAARGAHAGKDPGKLYGSVQFQLLGEPRITGTYCITMSVAKTEKNQLA